MTIDEQLAFLRRGTLEIIREEDLRAKLEKSARTGLPLRVKLGADPTAPDLHLGHAVVIRKLRDFQILGHTVVFLIGDFTGMIGDPTGKSATRPRLSRREIEKNAETYKEQIFKLLDREQTEICFNSKWFDDFDAARFIKLTSRTTVQQILERRDFQNRLEEKKPIALHELLYPLVQGYDSVELEADVELGGSDQKFNLLVGRDLQSEYGQEPQVVMTMPLLEGVHGGKKMSKSLDNYIGITDSPDEMYRKVQMYVSDDLMWEYYKLLTDLPPSEIEGLRDACRYNQKDPRAVKAELAKRIISDFYSETAARDAERHYEESVVSREVRGAVPEKKVRARRATVARLLLESGLAKSLKEIIKNSQTKIIYDGKPIEALKVKEYFVEVMEGKRHRLQYGKSNALELVGTNVTINRNEVDSDSIRSYGYDEELELLEVEFKDSGKLYEYYNVPRKAFDALENVRTGDESLGSFFNKNIRNEYSNFEIKDEPSRAKD